MATPEQISANRENSKRSTGPVSESGKAVSSRNHLVHGLCSADPVLPNEDRNLFTQLIEQFKLDWTPETTHEEFLVSEMAGAKWKLDRIQRIENDMFAALDDPTKAFTNKDNAAGFTRLERYRASLERTYHRAVRELRATQKEKLRIEADSRKQIEKAELDAVKAALFAPLPDEFPDFVAEDHRQPSAARQPQQDS